MNGVLNKTQLAEKRYRDKLRKDLKKEKKSIKNKKRELNKLNKTIISIIINYKKQKTTKLQKKKHYELNKRKAPNRKQNESDKEIKQSE